MPEKEYSAEGYLLAQPGHDKLVGKSVDVEEVYSMDKVRTEAVGDKGRATMAETDFSSSRRFWIQCNTAESLVVYPLKVSISNEIRVGGKKLPVEMPEGSIKGKTIAVSVTDRGYTWQKMSKLEEAQFLGAKRLMGAYDHLVYGTEERHVGEKWKVDPSFFDVTSHDSKISYMGDAWMTFEKVKFYNGLRCAYLSFEVDTVQAGEMGESYLKSRGRIIRSLDYGVDLYVAFNQRSRTKTGIGSTGDMSYRCDKKIILPKVAKEGEALSAAVQ